MKVYLLLAFCAAAAQAQLLPQGIPQTPGSSSQGSSSSQTLKPDTVVATVAGVSLTVEDVQKLMSQAPSNFRQLFQQNPQVAIGTAFQMKYLAEEAEKEHLDQQDPTKEDLEAALEWQKRFILANAMVNQVNNGYRVDQQQIQDFYSSHQSRYQEATIKIILLGFKPAPLKPDANKDQSIEDKLKAAAQGAVEAEHPLNQRTEPEARALADDIVKQLRAGAKFEDLVEKYSDDMESKASGGDFGAPIKATSTFAPEIKKLVFDLTPGEVGEPLRQANSYYIIRLETLKAQPLSEVGGAIAKEIRDNHMNDYINDLNKRFTLQVLRPDYFVQAQKNAGGQPAAPVSQAPAAH